MSAARTASAPAEAGPSPSSVSGAAATEPSHDATSPRRCAHPPAAAGSCRTSTRTSSSPGAFAPVSLSPFAVSRRPTGGVVQVHHHPADVHREIQIRRARDRPALLPHQILHGDQPSTQPRR